MNIPLARSTLHVVGTCRHVTADGNLAISINDVTFNVLPPTPQMGPNIGSASPTTPSKKRHFNATIPQLSPSSPTAGPSTTALIASSSLSGASGSSAAPTVCTPLVPLTSTSLTLFIGLNLCDSFKQYSQTC